MTAASTNLAMVISRNNQSSSKTQTVLIPQRTNIKWVSTISRVSKDNGKSRGFSRHWKWCLQISGYFMGFQDQWVSAIKWQFCGRLSFPQNSEKLWRARGLCNLYDKVKWNTVHNVSNHQWWITSEHQCKYFATGNSYWDAPKTLH